MAIQFNPTEDGRLQFTNSDGEVVFTVTESGGVVLPSVATTSAVSTPVEGQVVNVTGVGLTVYTSGAWVSQV